MAGVHLLPDLRVQGSTFFVLRASLILHHVLCFYENTPGELNECLRMFEARYPFHSGLKANQKEHLFKRPNHSFDAYPDAHWGQVILTFGPLLCSPGRVSLAHLDGFNES